MYFVSNVFGILMWRVIGSAHNLTVVQTVIMTLFDPKFCQDKFPGYTYIHRKSRSKSFLRILRKDKKYAFVLENYL
jgi:hypothetical protein